MTLSFWWEYCIYYIEWAPNKRCYYYLQSWTKKMKKSGSSWHSQADKPHKLAPFHTQSGQRMGVFPSNNLPAIWRSHNNAASGLTEGWFLRGEMIFHIYVSSQGYTTGTNSNVDPGRINTWYARVLSQRWSQHACHVFSQMIYCQIWLNIFNNLLLADRFFWLEILEQNIYTCI